MKISEKEAELIAEGKLHAVIRKVNISERVGDILFDVDDIAYRFVEKKKWSLFRVAADRGKRDFSCAGIFEFKVLYDSLYGDYSKHKKDIVYMIVFKAEKKQKTLGGW